MRSLYDTVCRSDPLRTDELKSNQIKMHNRIFNWGISVVAALSMVSCTETEFDATDVPFGQPGDRAETIEVPLRLHTDNLR